MNWISARICLWLRLQLAGGIREVKDAQRSFKLYRSLQILLKGCNAVYNVLIGSAVVLLILFSVFCTYGAIRFHGLIAISFAWIGISCTGFLAILLGIMAEFNNKSKLLLVAFDRSVVRSRRVLRKGEFAMLRRQLRAMTDLKFRVGALYYVDKGVVMTTFKIIFDSTVNLLILH